MVTQQSELPNIYLDEEALEGAFFSSAIFRGDYFKFSLSDRTSKLLIKRLINKETVNF